MACSADTEAFKAVLHPEIEAKEFPNAITPKGQIRGWEAMMKGIAASKALLQWHRFDITATHLTEETVIIEAIWTGKLAIDAGSLKKDQELRASICFLFEFKDGLIYRQRNYDCYDPF